MRFARVLEASLLLILVSPTGLAAPKLATQAPAPRTGLLISANGGVVIPFAGLGVGGRGEARASVMFGAVPLGISFAAGLEQHSAKRAVLASPGGFDAAATDNQSLFPLQLLASLFLLRDEHHCLQLSAGYGLLVVAGVTQLLGRVREETGLGHEVAAELTYSRRFLPLELQLIARYSVRRTAVGAGSAALEPPWYQTAGVLIGLGVWP